MDSQNHSPPPPPPTHWLRIIQINDVYELDNFPRLKTLIAAHSSSSCPNNSPQDDDDDKSPPSTTIVVCAGDFLAPSLLSSLDHGASMMHCLRTVGVTHVCLGNHEADVPWTALQQHIRDDQHGTSCDDNNKITWINSNMPELNTILSVDMPIYDIVTVPPRTTRNLSSSSSSNDKDVDVTISKRVALLGLLTDDPSLYRPGAFNGARMDPIVPCTEALLQQLLFEQEPPNAVDFVLPLTHQSMAHDRQFAQHFTGRTFPLVCGGHDHEIYNEVVAGCRIVKAGMDALHAAVIDIQWYGDTSKEEEEDSAATSSPSIEVKLVSTLDYAPCPVMQQRVAGHQRILQELERARLFRIKDWMSHNTAQTTDDSLLFSTRDNRLGPSTGTSALCTMLRMGMRAQCAIINAGAVRGNKIYNNNNNDDDDDQYFCWSDLKAEIPFSTSLTACYIPGHVLEATIAYSRRGSRQTPPQASGGYLHTCRNIVFNDQDNRIESIGGKPLDPHHEYLTALPVQFFAGIDNHQPLLDWAAALRSSAPPGVVEPTAPPLYSEESAIPAKMVLVQVFSALVWLQLGTFDEIDQNQDGVLQYKEVAARVSKLYGDENVADLVLKNLFSVADLTGDGTISPLEMMIVQFAATDLVSHVCTGEELQTLRDVAAQVLGKHPTHEDVRRMVQQLFATLDVEGDGKIQRHEVMKLVGRLHANELLQ